MSRLDSGAGKFVIGGREEAARRSIVGARPGGYTRTLPDRIRTVGEMNSTVQCLSAGLETHLSLCGAVPVEGAQGGTSFLIDDALDELRCLRQELTATSRPTEQDRMATLTTTRCDVWQLSVLGCFLSPKDAPVQEALNLTSAWIKFALDRRDNEDEGNDDEDDAAPAPRSHEDFMSEELENCFWILMVLCAVFDRPSLWRADQDFQRYQASHSRADFSEESIRKYQLVDALKECNIPVIHYWLQKHSAITSQSSERMLYVAVRRVAQMQQSNLHQGGYINPQAFRPVPTSSAIPDALERRYFS